MKKNIFVSGITLMTMLLAVGCSNNATQSNTNNEAKSTKTSHKKSHKAKKHTTKKDKTDIDTDNSETTNSDKKLIRIAAKVPRVVLVKKLARMNQQTRMLLLIQMNQKIQIIQMAHPILQHLILKIMAVKVLRQLIALQMLCLIRWFLILSKKMATQVAMAQTTLR